MRWIDTKTNEEAATRYFGQWDVRWSAQKTGAITGQVAGPEPIDGEFWADALNKVKSDPVQRYDIAQRNLPLPAAWREMAIALRAMIRDNRKAGETVEPHLRELHHLAALWSFGATDDATVGSAYDLLDMIPYMRLAALDLSYDRVGCDELILLGKTDRKWMRDAWGEPSANTTAQALYLDLFKDERRRVDRAKSEHRTQQHNFMFERIGELRKPQPVMPPPSPAPPLSQPVSEVRPFAPSEPSHPGRPSPRPKRSWLARLLGH